jgi:predicted nucleotidyltransferase
VLVRQDFDSVLRGEDTATNDLDLLVDPLPGAALLDLGDLQMDLEDLLGIRVGHQHGWAGAGFDNIFVERLWRSVKYEDMYLKGYPR